MTTLMYIRYYYTTTTHYTALTAAMKYIHIAVRSKEANTSLIATDMYTVKSLVCGVYIGYTRS